MRNMLVVSHIDAHTLSLTLTLSRSRSQVRHVLVAYFALLDVSNVVDLTRSEIDEALRLFNKVVKYLIS